MSFKLSYRYTVWEYSGLPVLEICKNVNGKPNCTNWNSFHKNGNVDSSAKDKTNNMRTFIAVK